MSLITDYGHPERVFFENPKLFGLGLQIRPKSFGTFGVFLALSMLSVYQPLFLQKTKTFYIQIPKIHLGVGVEFGPERIRYVFSHRVSVVHGEMYCNFFFCQSSTALYSLNVQFRVCKYPKEL